ncbi:hypothetical protein [Falsiroseomonas ponticola]|uniref:hypothetical protein n=1 Tax=Falsiroseomonas ponticola TaxID=2786951 RepID=UPI00193406D9|nr:hypothetical protein [Roseomonas ponticola]
MQLQQFRERLKALMGDSSEARPFVCRGNPYRCQAFIVGINPASSVPFWPFWSDTLGFDWPAWRDSYLETRRIQPLKPGKKSRLAESPTRRTIGWIVDAAAPLGILETNLYVRPTPAAADLRSEDRNTQTFEYLLTEIRPQVLLLHGREVATALTKMYGAKLAPTFAPVSISGHAMLAACVPHLSRGVSREKAHDLGRQLRELCKAQV